MTTTPDASSPSDHAELEGLREDACAAIDANATVPRTPENELTSALTAVLVTPDTPPLVSPGLSNTASSRAPVTPDPDGATGVRRRCLVAQTTLDTYLPAGSTVAAAATRAGLGLSSPERQTIWQTEDVDAGRTPRLRLISTHPPPPPLGPSDRPLPKLLPAAPIVSSRRMSAVGLAPDDSIGESRLERLERMMEAQVSDAPLREDEARAREDDARRRAAEADRRGAEADRRAAERADEADRRVAELADELKWLDAEHTEQRRLAEARWNAQSAMYMADFVPRGAMSVVELTITALWRLAGQPLPSFPLDDWALSAPPSNAAVPRERLRCFAGLVRSGRRHGEDLPVQFVEALGALYRWLRDDQNRIDKNMRSHLGPSHLATLTISSMRDTASVGDDDESAKLDIVAVSAWSRRSSARVSARSGSPAPTPDDDGAEDADTFSARSSETDAPAGPSADEPFDEATLDLTKLLAVSFDRRGTGPVVDDAFEHVDFEDADTSGGSIALDAPAPRPVRADRRPRLPRPSFSAR